jgi:hypothetical protein
MAGSSSDSMHRQVQRLFNLGTVGSLTDAQLLDSFVSTRDEAREAATVRIALGFMAGNTAGVLARGVLNSMLMNQLKVAAVLLLLGIGSSYWAWRAIGAASDDKGPASSKQVVGKTAAPTPKAQATPPAVTFRLAGSVRVEGTGEPVKGGQFDIQLGDLVSSNDPGRIRTVTSGVDGQFVIDLPGGQAFLGTFQPPVGYWALKNNIGRETLVLSPSQPIYRKDFLVRRGTIWPFRLTIGLDMAGPWKEFGSDHPVASRSAASSRARTPRGSSRSAICRKIWSGSPSSTGNCRPRPNTWPTASPTLSKSSSVP